MRVGPSIVYGTAHEIMVSAVYCRKKCYFSPDLMTAELPLVLVQPAFNYVLFDSIDPEINNNNNG